MTDETPPKAPCFGYFGSKWRMTPKYPVQPRPGDVIVEPFAGSACYTVRNLHIIREAHLFDVDENIAMAWDFLTHATKQDILDLPIMCKGEMVADVAGHLSPEAQVFLGFRAWAGCRPAKRVTSFGQKQWNESTRAKMAAYAHLLRKITFTQASYADIPDRFKDALVFVDPPYRSKGIAYKHGAGALDFDHLADWCRAFDCREMVVSEGEDHGEWLPFTLLSEQIEGMVNSKAKASSYKEHAWVRPK